MAARRLKATASRPPISKPPPAARPAAADPLPLAPTPAPPLPPAATAASPALTSPALPRPLAVTTARSAAGQRPEHVLHDPAVPVVVGLARRVDPHDRRVLLAAEHDQRRALLKVRAGRLVDRGLLPLRQLDGHAALGARRELVAQPDVGERAADHHFVVAAPRAVGVEVTPLDPVAGQVLPGRAV